MVKDVSPTCKDDHHAAHAMQATSRENIVLLSTNQCSEVMAGIGMVGTSFTLAGLLLDRQSANVNTASTFEETPGSF